MCLCWWLQITYWLMKVIWAVSAEQPGSWCSAGPDNCCLLLIHWSIDQIDWLDWFFSALWSHSSVCGPCTQARRLLSWSARKNTSSMFLFSVSPGTFAWILGKFKILEFPENHKNRYNQASRKRKGNTVGTAPSAVQCASVTPGTPSCVGCLPTGPESTDYPFSRVDFRRPRGNVEKLEEGSVARKGSSRPRIRNVIHTSHVTMLFPQPHFLCPPPAHLNSPFSFCWCQAEWEEKRHEPCIISTYFCFVLSEFWGTVECVTHKLYF